MGTCKYCQKSAGLLRSAHSECEARHSGFKKRIESELERALTADVDDLSTSKIDEFSKAGAVSASEVRDSMASVWERAVERYLADGSLEATEESRLQRFMTRFGLEQAELDRRGALSRLAKAGAIRDVLEGKIPARFQTTSPLPVNLTKGERVVWAFEGTSYFEDKTKTVRVGSSQGVSVRVMKGFYYRVGAFQSEATRTTERELVDHGLTVFTDKSIYFTGPRKSLRIPLAKVVAFQPFSNGLGVVRDAVNAKSQVFVTGDGWFSYNLVTNLARIE